MSIGGTPPYSGPDYGPRRTAPMTKSEQKMVVPITVGSATAAGFFLGTSLAGFPLGTLVGVVLGALGGVSLLENVCKDFDSDDEDLSPNPRPNPKPNFKLNPKTNPKINYNINNNNKK